MYRIAATIEGIAPILFNQISDYERAKLDGDVSGGGKRTKAERIAEAHQRVYRDERGLILPAWNLKRCIVDGATKAGLKEGRAGLGSYLMAEMFADGDPAFGVTEPDYIDERLGRIPPRTGAAAILRRPALRSGWHLTFALNVYEDRRPSDAIRRALTEAGIKVGLGAHRPEFGRFLVTAFEAGQVTKVA